MCAFVPDCAELCGFVSAVIVGADFFPKFFLCVLGSFFEAELNFFAGSAIIRKNLRFRKKTQESGRKPKKISLNNYFLFSLFWVVF